MCDQRGSGRVVPKTRRDDLGLESYMVDCNDGAVCWVAKSYESAEFQS